MESSGFLFQAFIYLGAAVVSVPIAKRLGLGSVLGYLLAGVIIGPHGLRFIGDARGDVMSVAEFGVVMMLFLVGLELRPNLLWRLRGPIFGAGTLQVALTAAFCALIALYFHLAIGPAIAVGLILSDSSTAIAVQSLSEKGWLNTKGGQNSVAVLLFQDLSVIPILAVLPFLATTHPTSTVATHAATWFQPLLVLATVSAIVVGGRFLIGPAFHFLALTRLHEVFTAAALLLVVGIALAMQLIGLSPALGTFLAGVVLAESEYRHELESDIEPFKGLLLGLFFISVGASIDLPLVKEQPLVIFGLVLSLLVVKFLVLLCIGKVTNLEKSQNFTFAFALAQGGEFAFVLISFAAQNQVIDQRIGNLLVATVALSMVMSPFLFTINERLGDASRMELLHAAGANTAKLMVIAIDDEEKSLEIVDMVHKHFPNLQILARAAGRDHAYRLLGHDVEHIFRETLGSSLDLSVVALRMLGFRAYEALRVA